MSQPFRSAHGGRIHRDQPLHFTFDGRPYSGVVGDTLASALLANDVHLVGRSFKYHRPRGILSAGSEEPNALVTIDRGGGRVTPNLRATQQELYDGLTAHSQNRFPSLRFDLGAAAGLAAPLLSAGFYYKTFMWPPSFWKRLYEPAIRAAAGLGRAPGRPDPDRYLHHYAHCDVLVIGAGPAGLAAAMAAVAAGARVILCDEQAEPGGSLLAEADGATIDGWPVAAWLTEVLTTLSTRALVLPRTTAFGWYPDTMIGLVERVTDHLAESDGQAPRERLWQVRAGRVVIATGAIERPLVFPHNDRPGIMLADAARTYLNRYGVKVGARAVVATTDDSAYRAALDLHAGGVAIAGIVDRRMAPTGEAVEAARAAGIPIHPGATVAATDGRRRVHSVRLSGGPSVIPCDTVLMCGGWTPTVHLHAQSRARLRFETARGVFLPGESAPNVISVGACNGTVELAKCLTEGYAAGAGPLAPRGFSVTGVPAAGPTDPPEPAAPHPKAFVDFQNDVTTRDLHLATQEGFHAIEHVKRYTTTGMATDQGKTSNVNALTTVAGMLDRPIPDVGLTTFRLPYTPVTFGAFAGSSRGALFDPIRHTPIHDRAAAQGAVFEDVGTWKRARYFPRAGETMDEAVTRECRAVRRGVGVFDASTLGKIEVVGPDAAAFLDRLYPSAVSRLETGRCRYALLLGEDGFIRDDGVIARLADDRFHVTTTTGGAAAVLHQMEDYRQTEFTDLPGVWLTSVTEQFAVIAVQGPRAVDVLAHLVEDLDVRAMQHMAVASCRIAGVPGRLFRVSFTGEIGFEINVPANLGQFIWDAVMAAGAAHDITPYGTETMHVLRAEVGYVIVGQETDGTVTPDDLGLTWTIARSKPDFVGKRSLSRPDMLRPDRKQLVGLLPRDPSAKLEEGAQVVADAASTVSLGHVTSAYRSDVLGRRFALALVSGGRARIGQHVCVALGERRIEVEVTRPKFIEGGLAVAVPQHIASGDTEIPPPPPGVPSGVVRTVLPAVPRDLTAGSPASSLVRLTALAATTRLAIGAQGAAATAIGLAAGVLLGSVPCRTVVGRERAALWVGPDEWLVLAPESETGLVARAIDAATEHEASVVDVSHRHASIEIAGPRAAWCLNGFCALDLDLAAFPVGMCTRTLLGKAEIVLWRLGTETFHLEVARSFAPYVWQCLEEARREFLDPPAAC
ncbi:MAG: sarcosine oxidase subunit alpha family protein [Acetobacteraceae bacterium]